MNGRRAHSPSASRISRRPVFIDPLLYGYPIQQAALLLGLDRHVWWQNAIVSVPLITLFAIFSWHIIAPYIATAQEPFIPCPTACSFCAQQSLFPGRRTAEMSFHLTDLSLASVPATFFNEQWKASE